MSYKHSVFLESGCDVPLPTSSHWILSLERSCFCSLPSGMVHKPKQQHVLESYLSKTRLTWWPWGSVGPFSLRPQQYGIVQQFSDVSIHTWKAATTQQAGPHLQSSDSVSLTHCWLVSMLVLGPLREPLASS